MPLMRPTAIDLPVDMAIDTTGILQESGLVPKSLEKKSEISKFLDNEGMDREAISKRISTLAYNSEDEKIQLQAVTLALKLHGELDKEKRESSKVQINFIGATPEMLNILIPR